MARIKPMRERAPKGKSPMEKGHEYGRGSLAEPCKKCGTSFSFAYYYPVNCPGRIDKDYQRKAERHHRKVWKY